MKKPRTSDELHPKSWTQHLGCFFMSGKRKYSDLQRLEAVLDVLKKGISLCEVARRLGTDHKNVRLWVAFYEQYGAKG